MSPKAIDTAFLVLVEEMNKNENKYLYSAQLMNQALLQLLETKDLDYITVTEITKKAGVHRSTFYLHYDNVYELFEETVENLNKEFVSWFLKEKKDVLLQKEFCNTLYQICRFMGKPVLLNKGKDILVYLLTGTSNEEIKKFTRETMEKIIALQM